MTGTPLFTGVCTAMITPFCGGQIDYPALDGLLERQINAKVDALLIAGTTGEPSTLSDAEWESLTAHALTRIAGRVRVIVGTGSNNLRVTLRRAGFAADHGADAQLCVTPYYNKATQAGLYAYFTRIADECALPVMLYNVPARTGLNMLPETCERLAHHPGMIGVKEAADDLGQLARLTALTPLPVYCGSDQWMAPALRLGARGVISVLSNLCPEAVRILCQSQQKGCEQSAAAQQRHLAALTDALFCEVSPSPVKYALSLLGLCRAEVRLPLVPLQPGSRERLQSLLARHGLLPA